VTQLRRRRPPGHELQEAYRDNVGSVYAYFAYFVGAGVAEDLTAATFERVVRAWKSFDPQRATERTWIFAIARNILTDHYRRQQHRSGPSLDEQPGLLSELASADDPAARRLSIEAVKDWLSRLAPREREVLALRYGADLSTAEIARALGLSQANVHQIASRALRRLREDAESSEASRTAGRFAAPRSSVARSGTHPSA
jgi:RNA polymerase sigma factor (sigma-70 family)